MRLLKSNTGNVLKAIRDDETAAKAMGVDVFRYKLLSFTVGSFFAGVGGALLASLLTTIDPKMFLFTLTFNVLMIVVTGRPGLAYRLGAGWHRHHGAAGVAARGGEPHLLRATSRSAGIPGHAHGGVLPGAHRGHPVQARGPDGHARVQLGQAGLLGVGKKGKEQ